MVVKMKPRPAALFIFVLYYKCIPSTLDLLILALSILYTFSFLFIEKDPLTLALSILWTFFYL